MKEQKIICESDDIASDRESNCALKFEKRIEDHIKNGWTIIPETLKTETKQMSNWIGGHISRTFSVVLEKEKI